MVKINGWAMTCWRGTALSRQGLIGGTTNHRLSVNREMIEKACPTSSRAREYLPGLLDWSIDVERMILANDTGVSVTDEVSDLKAGTLVNVCLQIGLDYVTGTALVERVEMRAPLRGKATASVKLKGSGGLTITDVWNDGFTYTFPIAFDAALGATSETE